jgi:hypothetical protein
MFKHYEKLCENYNKIFEVLQFIFSEFNFLHLIRKQKLSYIKLIVVSITAKYLSIKSECQLFRKVLNKIYYKIGRSNYDYQIYLFKSNDIKLKLLKTNN